MTAAEQPDDATRAMWAAAEQVRAAAVWIHNDSPERIAARRRVAASAAAPVYREDDPDGAAV